MTSTDATNASEILNSNDTPAVAASRNLIYAFVLVRVISTFIPGRAASLFGWMQEGAYQQLPNLIALFVLGLWTFRKRGDRVLFAAAAAYNVYQFCFGYSALGAFSVAPFYLFTFGLLFLRRPSSHLKDEAAVLIGLIFLTSAVQKINPNFLAGQEFEMKSPFMAHIHLLRPDFVLFETSAVRKLVAGLTIITELAVGFGIFFRPAIFAQVVAFFTLVLSLFHPPVLYVYLFFLPLIVLIPAGFPPKAVSFLARPGPMLPVAIAVIIKVFIIQTIETPEIIFVSFFVVAALLCAHAWALRSAVEWQAIRTEKSVFFPRGKRSFVIPTILIAVFIGSYFFLPSPLGFSMFAARRFSVPYLTLEVQNNEACGFARQNWRFARVTDSSLEFTEDGKCLIRFPTKSGLRAIATGICSAHPTTTFKISSADSNSSFNCATQTN